MLDWLLVLFVFVVGMYLSFFFSGIETAFYRVSKLRLSIETQSGDKLAQRILKFATNPPSFVSTMLIGNNVSNYLVTLAISSGAILAFGSLSEATEVTVTLIMSPIIFVYAELLPKILYYQAPLLMLKRHYWTFWILHVLMLPLSWPLMMLTLLLQKVGRVERQPMEKIFGRRPLANVIGQGHEEGVIIEIQQDLIQGVFLSANKPLGTLVTPRDIAFFQIDNPSRTDLLEHARAFGLMEVTVLSTITNQETASYYRVADLLIDQATLPEIRRSLPQVPATGSRLETLLLLQEHQAEVGAVMDQGKIIGTVRRRVLTETLLKGGLTSRPILA